MPAQHCLAKNYPCTLVHSVVIRCDLAYLRLDTMFSRQPLRRDGLPPRDRGLSAIRTEGIHSLFLHHPSLTCLQPRAEHGAYTNVKSFINRQCGVLRVLYRPTESQRSHPYPQVTVQTPPPQLPSQPARVTLETPTKDLLVYLFSPPDPKFVLVAPAEYIHMTF